jgi:hypothetical protein
MTNYILISKTFAETTPESSEFGDFSKTGFISECEQVTFRELVELMIEHREPSQSPNDGNTHVWYSSNYVSNYRTGTEREDSLHYHRGNAANCVKYWKLARIAADKQISKWNNR